LQEICQAGRALRDHAGMDPLTAAFDRIDDFVAVQSAAGGITVEAVELLQRAVGVEDEQRAMIAQRVETLGASGGAVLLGVLVGLFAAETQA
jgi:hypothetical protein